MMCPTNQAQRRACEVSLRAFWSRIASRHTCRSIRPRLCGIRRCASACFVMLVSFLAPLAMAQDPKPDLGTLNLEQLMKVQFSTASKHSQDVSETPASVTIITRAEIRAYGYRTLPDILQGVRGFWVNSDRNYSYLGVRGVSRPGDYNTRILLLIDGHRINDNVFDQALIGTEFPLDVDLIERIEIVRGPASCLYGTNAFFGVINVITQQPPIVPTAQVSAEAGTEFMRKARVTVGLPQVLNGALLSASMYRSDGYDRLYFPEFNSPETNNGIASRVDGDRYGSAFALLKWKHFEFEALAGSREKLIPTGSFDTIFGDPANRTVDSRGFSELRYQRDFLSGLQLTARWYYDSYLYKGTYAYEVNGVRELQYDMAQGEWIGTEFDISSPLGHRNILTAGTEIRYNFKQVQEELLAGFPGLYDHRSSSVVAFYGQDELRITPHVSINAGLRSDYYSTFGTAISPRIAAIFRSNEKTAIKYTFGQAFRAPNAYEMYYSDGVSVEANPTLQPETIASHSVAIERSLTPTFRVVAEGFYSKLENLLDQRLDPKTGMAQYVNMDSASGKGLEFELELRRNRWRSDLSYTLQRGSNGSTGTTLANSPLHLAKVKIQAPLRSVLLAAAEINYISPQTTYLDSRIPDFLATNLTFSTTKPVAGFDVSASSYNLFDRRNYDPASPGLSELRLLQDGRGFRIKLSRTISRR